MLQATKEKFFDSVHVITQEDCLNLPKATLKNEKRKVFVFEDFDVNSKAFNYIFTAETVQ